MSVFHSRILLPLLTQDGLSITHKGRDKLSHSHVSAGDGLQVFDDLAAFEDSENLKVRRVATALDLPRETRVYLANYGGQTTDELRFDLFWSLGKREVRRVIKKRRKSCPSQERYSR